MHQKGEKITAITELEHLIQEVPLYLNAYTLLAEYQLADGDRASAIATLKKALSKAAPSLKSGFQRKIAVLMMQFRSHESYSEFHHAIKLMRDKDFEAAIPMLEAVLKKEGDNQEVLLRLGQCYFLQSEFKKAVMQLEKSTHIGGSMKTVWSWLGRSYFLLGDVKKSEAAFKNMDWKNRDAGEMAAIWWSETLVPTKGKKAAILFLEKQLERFPDQVRVLVKLAELRSDTVAKNNEPQWQAKKEYQLALSRLEDDAAKEASDDLETSFVINQLNPEQLKKKIQEQILKLEEKLKKLDESHP